MRGRNKRRIGLAAAVILLAGGLIVRGEDSLLPRRARLDSQFAESLAKLAARADELKLTEQAKVTREWQLSRDRARCYLFVPENSPPAQPPGDAPVDSGAAHWKEHFLAIRRTQAEGLFELAKASLAEHHPELAWPLLYEVLHEDPDHAQARAILGYLRAGGGWRLSGVAPTARPATLKHPRFGWAAGKYWRIESPHYEIVTSHSAEQGLAAAAHLEELYCVWRQLFVRYWTSEAALAQRFASPPPPTAPLKRFQVVLFRDREEYAARLSYVGPQIGQSLGYYSDRDATAFFFAGDQRSEATWRHEGGHQLFQEVLRGPLGVAEEGHMWLVEGLALYLESLERRTGYYTSGGIDAERLQYARHRALVGQEHLPLTELVQQSRESLQRDPRVRQLYSESAGLVQFLLHGEEGRYREKLVDYARSVYARPKLRADELARILERPLSEIDKAYLEWLRVGDEDLVELARGDSRPQKLCLSGTRVTSEGLAKLARRGERLEWLGLARTGASEKSIEGLIGPKLTQLDLEGTQTGDGLLERIGRLSLLEELDLSHTPVSDAGLAHLAGLKRLKVLYLSSTKASDQAAPVLSQLRELETLDLQGTEITAAGKAALKKALPKWKQP